VLLRQTVVAINAISRNISSQSGRFHHTFRTISTSIRYLSNTSHTVSSDYHWLCT